MSDSNGRDIERVPTHIAGLDQILCGGFLRGGLYIVQGTPGTGKTTLANQICFNHIGNGGRGLYVTLLAEHHARMMQHLGSMSFFNVSKIPDQLSYISGFHTLRQDGLKGLIDLLRREIADCGASILILDGFATAHRKAQDEQDFNEFIHELQGFAIATECTMFLLASARGVRDTPEYTLVDGIVELSDHLLHWSAESTLQVIKLRGSAHLRGRHAFRITDDGLVVYPRIEASLARPSRSDPGGTGTVSSGVERLDTLLGGGLPAASTTMVMGPSGIGKTTLGLHFLATCSPAMPGLLFGFYETPPRLDAKVDAVCRPLRQLIDDGTVDVLWQPPTDGLIDEFGQRLLEAVRRRGVRRLFIDGLGAFQSVVREPERMDHFLTALMNELRVQAVTTIYSFEVPEIMGPHIRAPIGDLSSLAENLVLMRYIEQRARLHRLISILKVRDSDFDASMHQFFLTDQGLAIEETATSAEAIMAAFLPPLEGALPPPVRKQPPRRGG